MPHNLGQIVAVEGHGMCCIAWEVRVWSTLETQTALSREHVFGWDDGSFGNGGMLDRRQKMSRVLFCRIDASPRDVFRR
jgi:hypothetical protein